jgi:hypothetical protein
VAFQDLNPFPMKIISQKREYHRKSLKVMRKNNMYVIITEHELWKGPPPDGYVACGNLGVV